MSARPVWTAALVLMIAFGCNMVGRGVADSFMVFVLPLSHEFGWARAQVSSVYSAFLMVSGLAAPLTGLMIDRWGPRFVYPAGMLLLASACLVNSTLSHLWQFQLCVGLVAGLGVSMLGMVPASMLITRWFRDRMSTAMGVAYAGFGSGTIVVVPLAQHLIGLQGWRATYEAMGMALLVLVPALLLMPWQRLMAGKAPRAKAEAPPVEARDSLRKALRSREYWQVVQLFSFTAVTTYSVIAQVVPFLVQSGLSPLAAASAFGTAGLLSIFGIMTAGWAADRFGYRATATTSFAASFIGIASLLAFSWTRDSWLVVVFVVCFGSAMGARGPVVSALAARHFGGASFATIYGTMFAWMSTAGALAALFAGWLYDLTGGYRAGFVFSMAAVLVAASPFWVRRPLAPRSLGG